MVMCLDPRPAFFGRIGRPRTARLLGVGFEVAAERLHADLPEVKWFQTAPPARSCPAVETSIGDGGTVTDGAGWWDADPGLWPGVGVAAQGFLAA